MLVHLCLKETRHHPALPTGLDFSCCWQLIQGFRSFHFFLVVATKLKRSKECAFCTFGYDLCLHFGPFFFSFSCSLAGCFSFIYLFISYKECIPGVKDLLIRSKECIPGVEVSLHRAISHFCKCKENGRLLVGGDVGR